MTAPRLTSPLRLAGLALVGAALGAAAIYGLGSRAGNPGAAACAGDAAALARVRPRAEGELAAMVAPPAPRPIPALSFQDESGAPRSLAELEGRVVLLNLWATWCVPCREEMPALDRLQAELGGPEFQVVAVSIDTRDPGKPKRFLSEIGVKSLPFFIDPSAKVFQELKAVGRAVGMPTTLLIGRDGCEIGYLPGPADWASPAAKALVEAALGRS